MQALQADFAAEAEFVSYFDGESFERASDYFSDAKREDPKALVAREDTLATMAMYYGRAGLPELALEATSLCAEAYPKSFRAWNLWPRSAARRATSRSEAGYERC
jgi:hypothetical protein